MAIYIVPYEKSLQSLADDWGIDLDALPSPHADDTEQLCNYGNCTNYIDPATGRITGGVGPASCPCDLTRGWNRSYPEQQGKPHPPVKSRHPRVKRRRREQRDLQA